MPYMTAHVEMAERALYMRKYSVPFHAISHSFGGSAQKWFRIEQNLGKNPLVGTTLQQSSNLPLYIVSDEKHTWIKGEKAYVATLVSQNCFVGVSVAKNANETELTKAYQVFKTEAQEMSFSYAPKTVTTDGFRSTKNAWKNLFPSILLLLCFLHIFLKLRKYKKMFKTWFLLLSQKLWHCYEAVNQRRFLRRLRRLLEWCQTNELPSFVTEKIGKLRQKEANVTKAYDYPQAPRTTNMVDRLMKLLSRHLFNIQYFHGSPKTAELSIRGWALLENFAPSNPHTIQKHNGWQSPAERLNQFRYHDNWLQNLLVSAFQRHR